MPSPISADPSPALAAVYGSGKLTPTEPRIAKRKPVSLPRLAELRALDLAAVESRVEVGNQRLRPWIARKRSFQGCSGSLHFLELRCRGLVLSALCRNQWSDFYSLVFRDRDIQRFQLQ